MTLAKRLLDAMGQDGVLGLPRRTALYVARRVEAHADRWSKQIDFSTAAQEIHRRHGPLLARNKIFRGRHLGQRCFVIGNGPSINKQDLSPLASELTFVSNSFFKHPIVDLWQPTYYFFSDPWYFAGSEAASKSFAEISSSVQPNAYFVPHSACEIIERDALLPPDRTYYVGLAGNLAHDLSWTPDLAEVMPGVRTVPQLAIMAAMAMGCAPIYLLGLDHDWLAYVNRHYSFYTEADGEKHDWRYKDLMEAVLIMWRGYESLQKVATSLGISIINATRGGFLDVFERDSYESVVDKELARARSLANA